MNKLEKRILELEMENAELRDELTRLGYEHTFGTPTDGLEVGNPSDYGEKPWIYESPDGGKTVYRRKLSDFSHRELVKSPEDDENQLNLFSD